MAERVVIVTGGTSGIGLETSRCFVAKGERVVIVGRDQARGDAAIADLATGHATFYKGDVGDPATSTEVVNFTLDRYGRLDVLVNNAAIDHDESLGDVRPETALDVFRINFHGALWMTQAVISQISSPGGAIVNVGSRLGSIGIPGMSVYGAAKGALAAFTRGAAIELAPRGIRVNIVAPGFTETDLMTAWLSRQPDPERARRAETAKIPLGQLASSRDVAEAIVFLADDRASHITGVTLPVDGGYTAG
jgi:NAD(P)-dependent dehydrogenase (short-subunit alcohol dehydrogenase family)